MGMKIELTDEVLENALSVVVEWIDYDIWKEYFLAIEGDRLDEEDRLDRLASLKDLLYKALINER